MTIPALDTSRQRLIAAIASGVMISIAMSLHPWWPIARIAATPLLAASFSAPPGETVVLAVIAARVGSVSTTQERSSERLYASLEAKAPVGLGMTVYNRIGDTFGWLALAFGITLSAISLISERKEKDEEGA